MRNAEWWCGANNNEAPQNFDSASRRRHLERSREIFLAERSVYQLRYFNHRFLLIPNPLSVTSYQLLVTSHEIPLTEYPYSIYNNQ